MISSAQPEKHTCKYCSFVKICEHAPLAEKGMQKRDIFTNQLQAIKRKELLYTYRDQFKSVYAVHSGAIKTFQVDVNGQERIHGFYLPGEIIGLEAIHAGFYPYSAIALTQSSVCEIPFNNLLDFVAAFPDLQRHLILTLSQRISQGYYVTAPTAEQRLASFILDMAKRLCREEGQVVIDLPMSRYDIGNYLGLAPETVSRIFTRFQHVNLIQVQNKKITLLDFANLQWMAQDGESDNHH